MVEEESGNCGSHDKSPPFPLHPVTKRVLSLQARALTSNAANPRPSDGKHTHFPGWNMCACADSGKTRKLNPVPHGRETMIDVEGLKAAPGRFGPLTVFCVCSLHHQRNPVLSGPCRSSFGMCVWWGEMSSSNSATKTATVTFACACPCRSRVCHC